MPKPILKPRFTMDLPVLARREEIAALIAAHQVIVLCGETGSGKTTQLPQICLALGRGRAKTIAHTQPRRIAARAVAARVAEELATTLGPRGGVGYRVRFDDQSGDDNAVCVLTDGSLLAETQNDRELRRYDTIIVDEAHERSLNIDFLLGYLKLLLPKRPDLKVIITSATIDPQRFSNFFGGPAIAPVIEISGRTYPVEMRYRPMYPDDSDFYDQIDNNSIVDAALELCRPPHVPGGILVFLPGEKEIRLAAEALKRDGPTDAEILPLYSRLSAAEQQRIFKPQAAGSGCRIILSTNVAETSLTVPGIRYVIDTGLARMSRYEHHWKIQTLPIDRVSRASANQRAGRCGRVADGICIRLYSDRDFAARPLFTEPEVLRTNLASVILQAMNLGLGAVEEFPFIEPPSRDMIRDGYETLFELTAIDAPEAGGKLTPIGREIARLPLDPRVARMVIAARAEGCLDDVLPLAAVLSMQDPRERPMHSAARADDAQARFRNDASDFLTLLNIFHAAQDAIADRGTGGGGGLRDLCRDAFLSFNRMREWLDTYAQLKSMASDDDEKAPGPVAAKHSRSDAIHRALLTGLVTNICCKDDNTGHEYNGPKGARVSIFPGSVLFKKNPRWFIAAEIVDTTRLYARTLGKIDPQWVAELAPHAIKRSLTDAHFDVAAREPRAWERLTVNNIVVAARRPVALGPSDPAAARALLIEKGLVEGLLSSTAPFIAHNRTVMREAGNVQGKLRRHDVLAAPAALAAFFDGSLPPTVFDGRTLETWYAQASRSNPRVLQLSSSDVLSTEATAAATEQAFPSHLEAASERCALIYQFKPGHDDDGLTLTIPIEAFAHLDEHRPDWLVPGMLAAKVEAILKLLPRATRNSMENGALKLADIAAQCAGLMSFGEGPLAAAVSEALGVVSTETIPAQALDLAHIPDHLIMRIVVTDHHGKELAAERDVPPARTLRTRLAGRIEKALAARAQARLTQTVAAASAAATRDDEQAAPASAAAAPSAGATEFIDWSFGPLPDPNEPIDGGIGYAALEDRGDRVAFALAPDPVAAARLSREGVRRLFSLACEDELRHRLTVLPTFADAARHYKPIGTSNELVAAITDLIAERTFLSGQPTPTTKQQFEALTQSNWGLLARHTIDTAALIATILDHREKVAGRLGRGTNRSWATSLADIREHAAFLMPPVPGGFLTIVPLDRLRDYPRFVEGLRHRLFVNLREDGSTSETKPLAEVAPHWKRFTGWVANRLSALRAQAAESGASSAHLTAKRKHAMPPARRGAPVVNADAAAWAMQPGALPPEIAKYRWMLEDFRLTLFSPALAGSRTVIAKSLDEQWNKVQ